MAPTESPSGLTPDQLLDLGQLSLDIAGIFDPTPVTDVSNALISFGRRQWLDGFLSLAGVVPGLGDTAKIAKIPRYRRIVDAALDFVRANPQYAAQARPIFAKIKSAMDRAPLKYLPQSKRRDVEAMRQRIGDFLSSTPGT